MPRKKSNKPTAEKTIRNIRRNSRRKYSGEEKIRIVLEGLRGEETVAELCRREGISQSLCYRWSKGFLEADKQRLVGNTKRETSTEDVKSPRSENEQLKQLVAELALKNRVLSGHQRVNIVSTPRARPDPTAGYPLVFRRSLARRI